MATLNILDRSFDLPRYKLGSMIKAAPFIDAQKSREEAIGKREAALVSQGVPVSKPGETRTMVELFEGISDTVAVLHIGVSKIDPSVTLDAMLEDVDNTVEAYTALTSVMKAVLGNSGLKSGEAPAPSAQAEAEAASNSSSAPSSMSSSQPE